MSDTATAKDKAASEMLAALRNLKRSAWQSEADASPYRWLALQAAERAIAAAEAAGIKEG